MDIGDSYKSGRSGTTGGIPVGVRITDRLSGESCFADERNVDGRIRLEEDVPDASNHSGR